MSCRSAETGVASLSKAEACSLHPLPSRRPGRRGDQRAKENYDDGHMISGGMMWGMGLLRVLVVVILVRAAAALIKYLLFSENR